MVDIEYPTQLHYMDNDFPLAAKNQSRRCRISLKITEIEFKVLS